MGFPVIKKIIGFAVADQDPDDSSCPDLVKVSFKGFVDGIEYGLFICCGGK
jgi:hypothetical protein